MTKSATVKIIVDGFGGVGKTTLLKRHTNGTFDPETKLTIGVEFFSYDYNQLFSNRVKAQYWDIVGASRFNFLRPFCYRGANCIILVCDVTRPITLERIDNFVNIAKKLNIKSEQIILVAAKTDLYHERSIEQDYLSTFLEKYGFAEIIETSARNNHNLDVLFELATVIGMFNKGVINKDDFDWIKDDLKDRVKAPINEIHDVRKCWCCNKNLYFYEFCDSNLSSINEQSLLKLWESKVVELYCCSCYKKLNINQTI